MSTWPTFYTILFFIACGSAVAAAIALPFVYRKGMREIDNINYRIDTDLADREATSNVRVLRQFEAHARVQRNARRRRDGDAS